jgi:hypothetical protein
VSRKVRRTAKKTKARAKTKTPRRPKAPLSGRGAVEPAPSPWTPSRLAYNVRDFGAVGDGATKDTAAIAAAIRAASKAGGGTVYFPAGRYLTGTISLHNYITLHLEAGAVILGSGEAADYPVMPAGTIEGLNQDVRQSLIWALDCQDIAIAGRGTIDGQGWNWWHPPTAPNAQENGQRLRETLRPRLIELLRCTNVRLEGFTCRNSASWTVHPLVCDHVTVDGITIVNPPDSPNTDGIDPESCANVRIANCHIDVGDDCIALKSGKEDEPFRSSRPCENVTVTNCTMLHGHGGVVIGSEMAGGVRHVAISNCVFDGTDRGIRIKTCRGRGNAVEHVTASNLVMRRVRSVVHFTMFYTGTHLDPADDAHRLAPQPVGPGTPAVRHIRLSHILAEDCNEAGYLAGLPEMPIEDVSLANARITAERPCFAARVKGLTFRDVHILARQGPAIVCEDVTDLDIAGLRALRAHGPEGAIQLRNVTGASIRDCSCPAGTERFLTVADRDGQSAKATHAAFLEAGIHLSGLQTFGADDDDDDKKHLFSDATAATPAAGRKQP